MSAVEELQSALKLKSKQVRILEKKLETCMEMRKNIEEIRDSQTILFKKVNQDLEDSKQRIDQHNREIKSILLNIEQGIICIENDLRIDSNHSAYLANLVGRPPHENETIDTFLLANSSLSPDVASSVISVILSSIGEPSFMFVCNKHLLPSEFIIGNQRIVEVAWSPIVNDDMDVEKVIIALKDVTEIRKLKVATEERQKHLKIIAEIIENDMSSVAKFLGLANQLSKKNLEIIEDSNPESKVVELFRNAHTIKGNARSYKFEKIVDAVHTAETLLDDFRHGKSSWDQGGIKVACEKISANIREYNEILRNKLNFREQDSASFTKMRGLINGFDRARPSDYHKYMQDVFALVDQSSFKSLSKILKVSTHSLDDIALELKKPAPKVFFAGDVAIHEKWHQLLEDVFNHCLRNCLDHGIESKAVRLEAGKSESGQIYICSSEGLGQISISISDDGAGLDLPSLGRKCEIPSPSDVQIAETIFKSGVSTKENITSISGRGVGMDAVKAFVENEGGTVRVEFTGQRDERGYRPIKIIFTLPSPLGNSLLKSAR